MRVKDYLWKG